jgi:hypothetical protein
MKIVELVLDDNEESGIEAISIVESPAIESDFVALKSDEVKLAEVDTEKKILMGALLIPNKPIYRKTEGEEYYIYFSKDTVLKASQRYLTNGYQGNSTLEHSDNLQGLTLVESWIVEDDKYDKSRKYDMNVPIGTWMGTVKVNNEEVWNDYVKTGKVKGFSIEGFFADKIKASEMKKEEQEADLLLSKITSILKGERVELGLVDDALKYIKGVEVFGKNIDIGEKQLISQYAEIDDDIRDLQGDLNLLKKGLTKVEAASNDLGVNPNSIPKYKEALKAIEYGEKQLQKGKQLLK